MKKSLPQSNAVHLTAPSERGRKRRANTVRPYGWIDKSKFVILNEVKNLKTKFHRKDILRLSPQNDNKNKTP